MKSYKTLSVLALIGVIVLFYYFFVMDNYPKYGADHCSDLKIVAVDKSVQSKLISWVNNNIVTTAIDSSKITFSSTMPGVLEYMEPFDWSILQFKQLEHNPYTVSLVGPEERTFKNGKLMNLVSVSFAARSRYSILVRVDESKDDWGLGSDVKFLFPVTDNIGVFCFNNE